MNNLLPTKTSSYVGFLATFVTLTALVSTPSALAEGLAEDYVVRGSLNTRYTNAVYTLCLLQNGKVVATESSSISGPLASVQGQASGTGKWRITEKEGTTFIIVDVRGVQSSFGSYGRFRDRWTFQYKIEATANGWHLRLPSKTLELDNVTASTTGQEMLRNARSNQAK